MPSESVRSLGSSMTAGVPVLGGKVIWHGGGLRQRLQEEFRLLRSCSVIVQLLACAFVMVYCAGFLFRNLAFYRHRGLIQYAQMVMPNHGIAALANVSAVDVRTGQALPLASFLSNTSSEFVQAFNVSVPLGPSAANLSALNGRPFELLDVGHELLPDLSLSEFARSANEVAAAVSQATAWSVFSLPLLLGFPGKGRPYTVNMAMRLLRALAVVHTLRIATFLVTSLPGPAVHCQSVDWVSRDGKHGSEEIGRSHVQTVHDWFFSTWNMQHNSNCGDLVFSGHSATAITNTLTVQHYARQIFPGNLQTAVIAIVWTVCAGQLFFAVTTHNHYSVDIVIASYIAPLNFIAQVRFFPKDPTPQDFEPHDMGRELTNSIQEMPQRSIRDRTEALICMA